MAIDLRAIEKIGEYVDLGKKLLDVVDDEQHDIVSELINSLESYKNNLLDAQKQKTIALRKSAEADQKLAGVESLVLKLYQGDVDKTKAYMSQLSKQSHRQIYWHSVGGAVFYGILSALSSPFSLEKSRYAYRIYKNYAASAKGIAETMKIVAHTDKLRTETLQSTSSLEMKQAQTSARLQNGGIDEKVADVIATNPEQLAFAYFDYLKREHEIE